MFKIKAIIFLGLFGSWTHQQIEWGCENKKLSMWNAMAEVVMFENMRQKLYITNRVVYVYIDSISS